MDATRLDQFGFWSGWIRYDGKELKVDGRTTFGLKDRSWGIRPVGDAYTGGAPLAEYQAVHFCWMPIHWENECSLAGWFEDGNGYQWHTDQAFLPHYPSMEEIPGTIDPQSRVWQGRVEHQLNMIPGTRRAPFRGHYYARPIRREYGSTSGAGAGASHERFGLSAFSVGPRKVAGRAGHSGRKLEGQ